MKHSFPAQEDVLRDVNNNLSARKLAVPKEKSYCGPFSSEF